MILLESHPRCADHGAGHANPERHDLDALSASAGVCVAALADADHCPEEPTSHGSGKEVVDEVAQQMERLRGD